MVAVRKFRRLGLDVIKKINNPLELSVDEAADAEDEVEKQVKKTVEEVDKLIEAKAKDIMTI